MEATRALYCPIQPYQTRLVQLHGDGCNINTPVVCELMVPDLLHPTFEGLGLRSLEGDRLAEYDALVHLGEPW